MSITELLKDVVSAEYAIKQLKKPIEIPPEAFTDGTADVALVRAYSLIFDKLIVLGTDILNKTPAQAVNPNNTIQEINLGDNYFIRFRYSKDQKGVNTMFVGFFNDDVEAKTKQGYSTEFRVRGVNNGKSKLEIDSDESNLSVITTGENFTVTTTIKQANFSRLKKGDYLVSDNDVNFLEVVQISQYPDTLSDIRLARYLPPQQEGTMATLRVILYANPENYNQSVIKYSAEYRLYAGLAMPTSDKNSQSNVSLPFDIEEEAVLKQRVTAKENSLSELLPKSRETPAIIQTLAQNKNPILNP